ncbi:MAG: RNA polymerase subunit sigma-70 [Hamadaea sp.]|nr:RNA polymerase subunit sigma-70 [Hamadaea sp.]
MTATDAPEAIFEQHRRQLTAYCYRMLGSAFDAEDAVQETMIRAWRNRDRSGELVSPRAWLFRIATNVCHDMAAGNSRRARPVDLGPATPDPLDPGTPLPTHAWVEPTPGDAGDPAEIAVVRESVSLAFVAALQNLPVTQRAVLLLREVLRLSAAEVAELLDSSVPAVNSLLQRARATLAATQIPAVSSLDGSKQALLARYVDAFQRFDMDALMLLLHVDATLSMAPHTVWLSGADQLRRWWTGAAIGCRGSRLIPTVANGAPAFGQYRPSVTGAGFDPWALQVLHLSEDRIVAIESFLDTKRLFPLFQLPDRIDA